MFDHPYIIIAVLVVALVIAAMVFLLSSSSAGSERRYFGFSIPNLFRLKAGTSNEVTSAIKLKEVQSTQGSMEIIDKSGRGIDGSNLKSKGDMRITTAAPPDPK